MASGQVLDSSAATGGATPTCPELSVVMPCLNEARTLGTCIEQIHKTVAQHNIAAEIIVADNGSTDASAEIAARLDARVVPVSSRGYGSALMGGIAAARGRYVILGDADCSYDFGDIPKLLAELRRGADLVMGTRFRGGIRDRAMPALHRSLGNPVLSFVGRLFFKAPCSDFHCGLRGFSRGAYQRMDLRTTGMEFASEMVVKATLFRLKIADVPTALSPDGRDRMPHLRSWEDGWRHLRFLLMYSPRWLFLYPGAGLMLLETALGLWLLPGPRRVENTVFDIHTLLYAALAILIGFQAVLFAFLTKTFAIRDGLLPEDPRLARLFKVFTLEVGLGSGFLLQVAGLSAVVYSFLLWNQRGFGVLDPSHQVRWVACALTLGTLGVEVTLSRFVFSILGLARK